eukprot:175983_1
MPRRRHKQNKRKHTNKSKTKNNKAKKSNIDNHNASNNKIEKQMEIMNLFDAEQTPDDLKDVENARQILYKDLGVHSELNAEHTNRTFSDLLPKHIEHYYFSKNGQIIKEINSKIPLCHNQFGRGALMCIFAKPSDVDKYIFDTHLKKVLPMFIGRDLYNFQVIQNGQFIFIPLNILNILFPPATIFKAEARTVYSKK